MAKRVLLEELLLLPPSTAIATAAAVRHRPGNGEGLWGEDGVGMNDFLMAKVVKECERTMADRLEIGTLPSIP
jgi:hypothetical protein